MRKVVAAILAILIACGSLGCATTKNTAMPVSFREVGYCGKCNSALALDGLSEEQVIACPNCGVISSVADAKYKFKRKYIDKKNTKTAKAFLTVALVAAAVAGAIYGIPVPLPPIDSETFTPYRLPVAITCRKASFPANEINNYGAIIQIEPPAYSDGCFVNAADHRLYYTVSSANIEVSTYYDVTDPYGIYEEPFFRAELDRKVMEYYQRSKAS
jgi:hypothetical protein